MKGGTELPGGVDREPRPSESGPGEVEKAEEAEEVEKTEPVEEAPVEPLLSEGTVAADGSFIIDKEHMEGPVGEETVLPEGVEYFGDQGFVIESRGVEGSGFGNIYHPDNPDDKIPTATTPGGFLDVYPSRRMDTYYKVMEDLKKENRPVVAYTGFAEEGEGIAGVLEAMGATLYTWNHESLVSWDGTIPDTTAIRDEETGNPSWRHPFFKNLFAYFTTDMAPHWFHTMGSEEHPEVTDAAIEWLSKNPMPIVSHDTEALARVHQELGGTLVDHGYTFGWDPQEGAQSTYEYFDIGKSAPATEESLNKSQWEMSQNKQFMSVISDWDGGAIHSQVNEYMAGIGEHEKEVEHAANMLKMLFREGHPVEDTPMYRGITSISDERLSALLNDDGVEWKGFPSMSVDKNIARYFATSNRHDKGSKDVIFTVHGHEASDINWAQHEIGSQYTWEKESLNKPGSKYDIIDREQVYDDGEGGGVWHVTLKGDSEFGHQESSLPDWNYSRYWNPVKAKEYEEEEEWLKDEPPDF